MYFTAPPRIPARPLRASPERRTAKGEIDSGRAGPKAPSGLDLRSLGDREDVALGILEPSAPLTAQVGDALLVRLQAGEVVLLERHTLRGEVVDGCLDVIDVEAAERVLGGPGELRRIQVEERIPRSIGDPGRHVLYHLASEDVLVELPGSVEILRRDRRGERPRAWL